MNMRRFKSDVFPVKKLVVIALPLLSEAEIPLVQAIQTQLEKHHEVMVLSGGYEAALRRLAQSGQLAGAIGEFISGRWLEVLVSKNIPIIQIGGESTADQGIHSITTDLATLAEESAQLFLEQGVKSTAFLGPMIAHRPASSPPLGEAFALACRRGGMEIAQSPALSPAMVKNFLTTLPRPTGVLCATDRLARMAVNAVMEAGLRTPQDFAIIGVGNSRMESLHSMISLSSFELPLEEIGHCAGALMLSLLKGKSPLPQKKLIPARLHERESSLRSAYGVKRALAYLRSHPESSINAGELARLAGMSRRSFELAMLQSTGYSPGAYLQTTRQRQAEQLLKESDLDIAAIGRACGYQEPAVFSAAFRRWSGKSPREFRTNSKSTQI